MNIHSRHLLASCLVLALTAYSAAAGELYKVTVASQADAANLKSLRLDVLYRLSDGYLVLVEPGRADVLAQSGLEVRAIAANVHRGSLAFDAGEEPFDDSPYRLLFHEGGLKLYELSDAQQTAADRPRSLVTLPLRHPPVTYSSPTRLDLSRLSTDVDLDSMVALVSEDSLDAYSHYIESHFPFRPSCSAGGGGCRGWLYGKLLQFGFDSVGFQTWYTEDPYEGGTCRMDNVYAVKLGSELPLHQIVIGAHRDDVHESPGADDNGSGTCGVLELARCLADYDNRLTLVFVFFDAEELGMVGSQLYVDSAVARGDSIAMMLNFDMLAHHENDSEAYAITGNNDDVWGQLWAQLADSLSGIGITGHVTDFAQGFSDFDPFDQAGYNVLFLIEYVLSDVFHTPHDSTVYLNYDYFTRMVKASLATVVAADETYQTTPRVFMELLQDIPPIVWPDYENTLKFSASGYAGAVVDPSSALLHYQIDDQPWLASPASYLGDDTFEAMLPMLSCQERVSYYVSVQNTNGDTITCGTPEKPFISVATTAMNTVIDDDFETDMGWIDMGTADAGQWERGNVNWYPLGGVPGADYDGSGMLYQTGWPIEEDVDDGISSLVSPVFQNDGHDVLIEYARWFYSNEAISPYADSFAVRVYDGIHWRPLEVIGHGSESAGGWIFRSLWLANFMTPPQQMRLRFDADDFGADSHVEGAVDAVRITQFMCVPLIVTDSLPAWTIAVPYQTNAEVVGGEGELTFADEYDQLAPTGLVLTPDGRIEGIPLISGEIQFTLLVTDEASVTDEKPLAVTINPWPQILSDALPDALAGQPYEFQLAGAGGTGDLTWSDGGGLEGSGLSLQSDGLLSGVCSDTGSIVFTASATDEAGAVVDEALNLQVNTLWICGDINGDLNPMVDIADLVYLVDYMFTDGPPPPVYQSGDVDGSGGIIDVADLVYLVDYMFTGGPEPTCL